MCIMSCSVPGVSAHCAGVPHALTSEFPLSTSGVGNCCIISCGGSSTSQSRSNISIAAVHQKIQKRCVWRRHCLQSKFEKRYVLTPKFRRPCMTRSNGFVNAGQPSGCSTAPREPSATLGSLRLLLGCPSVRFLLHPGGVALSGWCNPAL